LLLHFSFPNSQALSEKIRDHWHEGNKFEDANIVDDHSMYFSSGMVVAKHSVYLSEAASKIASMDYFKKSDGWLQKSLESTNKDYAVAAIVDKQARQKADDVVKNRLGLDARLTATIEYLGTSFDPVYEVVSCKNLPTQHVLSFTHFCCAEVRLLLSGKELVIGWDYSELAGEGFSGKVKLLSEMGVEKAVELAKVAGFVHISDRKGCLVIIPSGFLVASITGDAGSDFIRWCVTPPEAASHYDGELFRTVGCLNDLLQSYPTLQKGLHQQWLQQYMMFNSS